MLTDTFSLNDRFRPSPTIIARQIAGEMILVPLRQRATDLDALFTLNETAAAAWMLLDGEHTLQQVAEILAQNFVIEPQEAGQDLLELTAGLLAIGAILPGAIMICPHPTMPQDTDFFDRLMAAQTPPASAHFRII